ncbi:MAG TPA: transcriptional repressor [Candidatus Hydrogenedentes bacterium]|nr:transcriptional repressor [Candidatus Hydrogenedentota bacterium]
MDKEPSTQSKTQAPGHRRNTRASQVIREVFMTARRPVSPQEVFEAGRKMLPSLGIATVYRWIRRLLEEGLLRELSLPDVGTRYEYVTAEHHHYFHCAGCDRLFVLTGCASMLESMIPEGFVMDSHEIVLRGRCAACASSAQHARQIPRAAEVQKES